MFGQTKFPSHRSTQPRRLQQRALRYYQHSEARRWRGILAAVSAVGVLGTGWVLLFSPWLRIDAVSIDGLQRVDSSTVQSIADARLDSRALWVLPRRSWALAPVSAISQDLLSVPAIAKADVRRRFPSTITISIEERLASVVWQSAGLRFEVDGTGRAIRELATSTASTLPLVVDSTDAEVALGGTVVPPSLVKLILEAHSALAGRGVESYSVEAQRDHVVVNVDGWKAYLGIERSLPDQKQAIDALLSKLSPENIERLDYLDVRLPDLPTYKLK